VLVWQTYLPFVCVSTPLSAAPLRTGLWAKVSSRFLTFFLRNVMMTSFAAASHRAVSAETREHASSTAEKEVKMLT